MLFCQFEVTALVPNFSALWDLMRKYEDNKNVREPSFTLKAL